MGDSAVDAFTAPGRAWRGEIAPENVQAEALNLAGWLGPRGLGRAAMALPAESALGVARGKLTSAADAAALEGAQSAVTTSGASPLERGSSLEARSAEMYNTPITPRRIEQDYRPEDWQQGLPASMSRPSLERGISLDSRSPNIYNPPNKPPRPFEADYPPERWPNGPPVDAQGNLTHDIEGRPFEPTADIVGRVTSGEADRALEPSQNDQITERLIGSAPASVAQGALPRGAVGAYTRNRGSEGPVRSINYLDSLPPEVANMVIRHEMGHMVDDLAGKVFGVNQVGPQSAIPQIGIAKELRFVYNDLNNPTLAARRSTFPDKDIDISRSSNLRNYGPLVERAAIPAVVSANLKLRGTIQHNDAAPSDTLVAGGDASAPVEKDLTAQEWIANRVSPSQDGISLESGPPAMHNLPGQRRGAKSISP
jgi:hypothetical protein